MKDFIPCANRKLSKTNQLLYVWLVVSKPTKFYIFFDLLQNYCCTFGRQTVAAKYAEFDMDPVKGKLSARTHPSAQSSSIEYSIY